MNQELVSKKTGIQFVKFAIIGILNTGIDWIVFYLLNMLVFFDIHEWFAKSISFVIAAINSFIWNSLWTFKEEFQTGMSHAKSTEEKTAKGSENYSKLLLVSLIGWGLNTLVFYVFRYQILVSVDDKYGKLLSLVFASGLVIIWNFLANKFWTYKAEKTKSEFRNSK